MNIDVLDPGAPINSDDLDRVFRGNGKRPARQRFERETACPKMLVLDDSLVMALVVYEIHNDELRVHELATAFKTGCEPEKIVDAALDALELACLAGGAHRLVVTSRAGTWWPVLSRRGFTRIDERCAGSWFEKAFR